MHLCSDLSSSSKLLNDMAHLGGSWVIKPTWQVCALLAIIIKTLFQYGLGGEKMVFIYNFRNISAVSLRKVNLLHIHDTLTYIGQYMVHNLTL